jgi:AcrR family transcriptional regulator
MNSNELNTEQSILEVAEAEFLEKGYGNAKTVSIAKRSGVTHSMLHYYFRTKEKLFQIVFRNKVQTISQLFTDIFDRGLPFEQTVRLLVETQFDFVARNPKLPRFILNEVLSNEQNRDLLVKILLPKLFVLHEKMSGLLSDEIAKGTVRNVSLRDLLMNVISMNVASFMALPILKDFISDGGESVEKLLKERRESNVQFVLNSLRP